MAKRNKPKKVAASIGGGILRGVLVVPANTRDKLTLNCGNVFLYFKRTREKITVTTQVEDEGFVESLPVYELVYATPRLENLPREQALALLEGEWRKE